MKLIRVIEAFLYVNGISITYNTIAYNTTKYKTIQYFKLFYFINKYINIKYFIKYYNYISMWHSSI